MLNLMQTLLNIRSVLCDKQFRVPHLSSRLTQAERD